MEMRVLSEVVYNSPVVVNKKKRKNTCFSFSSVTESKNNFYFLH